MLMKTRLSTTGTDAEAAGEDLRWAAAHTEGCGSGRSCLSSGTCLGETVCRALSPVGRSAGFVAPTPSAERCGYGIPSFKGFLCFCPTRWALHRAQDATAA